ncbi:MAG: VCBS repeat-containing protein [Candidatus Hydrogenedentes bacterium]|nr:VCBS repeat-containing protein [Candidatus Hydrogenedentota bacterium]
MNCPRRAVALLIAIVLGGICGIAENWVEDSFEDFGDGTLDGAGQNIYVSRDGSVRTIHRFDLNGDGWIDLLFNGTHDLIGILPSTLATANTATAIQYDPLAVEGALTAASGDLNRDGWQDLVFCPNRQGIQNPRRFVTTIYGGPDGWPASRSNGVLPTYDATDIAVADLNGDQWPDIVSLNAPAWLPGQPEGRIVRTYWGSEHGFILTRFTDQGVNGALALDAADFDADGAGDLAVLLADSKLQIFWGGKENANAASWTSTVVDLPGAGRCITTGDCNEDGRTDLAVGTETDHVYVFSGTGERTWTPPQSVEAFPATHVALGDADNDGHTDLLLTRASIAHAAGGEAIGSGKEDLGQVHVLWGGVDGWTRSRVTTLDVPYATAAASGDLNGDGKNDVAIAVYQGTADNFSGSAAFVFGNGTRTLNAAVPGALVSGATDVLIVPPHNNAPAHAVFSNSQGGHVDERVFLQLFWGNAAGFSLERVFNIPFNSGYEATAADLNADGAADLIALCSGHAGGATAEAMTQLGANIYWGGAAGLDTASPPAVLREYNLYSSNTADLDKDGYLDLVLGAFAPPPDGGPDLLVIYYGAQEGFSRERRVAIPSEGRSSICALADLNGDSWLDIAVTCYVTHCARVFWGGPEGYAADRQQVLEAPSPIELEIADLNADGRLDLIVGSYEDSVAGHHDTGIFIFWGSTDGYREWNAQWLPGLTPLGLTVADWDKDGFLDLFSAHYHGELTREQMPCYLYWGGQKGFETRNRTVFTGDSPSDALAADFDRDGFLDLALACHTRDGDHATDSKVFYNDGHRFAEPRVTKLPTVGPHWIWTEDMGHIANRGWKQTYTSSVHELQSAANTITAEVDATIPEGTTLGIEVRSATSAAALDSATWKPLQDNKASIDPHDRALQYRAVFTSDNGDRYPVLERVTVTVE